MKALFAAAKRRCAAGLVATALAVSVIAGLGAMAPASAAKNPEADVLHMQAFGMWEAWCVKKHAADGPECFVVNAIVYSFRPDFAAIVLYFYPPVLGREEPHVQLGMEAQSLLARGHVKVGGEDIIAASQCPLPGTCNLSGDDAAAIIQHFAQGEMVEWRHYDYAINAVDIEIELEGFAEAYAQAQEWAKALEMAEKPRS